MVSLSDIVFKYLDIIDHSVDASLEKDSDRLSQLRGGNGWSSNSRHDKSSYSEQGHLSKSSEILYGSHLFYNLNLGLATAGNCLCFWIVISTKTIKRREQVPAVQQVLYLRTGWNRWSEMVLLLVVFEVLLV